MLLFHGSSRSSLRSARPPVLAYPTVWVLPISMTSTVPSSDSAVVSRSWMPPHCWIWTSTVTPCSASNAWLSSVTHGSGADPSISQTVRESDEPPPPLEPLRRRRCRRRPVRRSSPSPIGRPSACASRDPPRGIRPLTPVPGAVVSREGTRGVDQLHGAWTRPRRSVKSPQAGPVRPLSDRHMSVGAAPVRAVPRCQLRKTEEPVTPPHRYGEGRSMAGEGSAAPAAGTDGTERNRTARVPSTTASSGICCG